MTSKNSWSKVGEGQEAYVLKGRPTEIEGIDGVIQITKPISIAKRINWSPNNTGHELFCKHLIIKILDEHVLKQGRYSCPHISFPVGSFNSGYYYEFVNGSEGFPLEIIDEDYRQVPVQIDEWNSFTGAFNEFGFNVSHDIADAIDGRIGKNIIFSEWNINEIYKTEKLHKHWKRIDFGYKSCPFDYRIFEKEIEKRKADFNQNLYECALLSARYSQQELNKKECTKLENLILNIRANIKF